MMQNLTVMGILRTNRIQRVEALNKMLHLYLNVRRDWTDPLIYRP